MSREVVVTALLLIGAGLAVFAWKVFALGAPLRPAGHQGIWQVDVEITVRGEGGEGSVEAALPAPDPQQRVFGEHFASDRLRLVIRDEEAGRVAVWRGWLEDVQRIRYGFRVQLFAREAELPEPPFRRPPRALRETYTRATTSAPATAPAVRAQLLELALPDPEDLLGRVRSIFAFVRHEIQPGESAGDDALLTLAQRSGSARGRERALATLLRGAGMPARLRQGLNLGESDVRPALWTEVWIDGQWIPMSAARGFFGELPDGMLAVANDDAPIVRGTGLRAVGYQVTALRESLSRRDLATLMLPSDSILQPLSLYRLSVPMQSSLRVLLLLPLGALVISLLRNGVGLPSFGTFMPMLIALALRGTGLAFGLALVALVLAIGVAGRLLLGRLRLLLVPRLSLLLCLVVLSVAVMGVLGRTSNDPDFYAGVVFPIVILTMLVERFTVVMAEEGAREALTRAVSSTGIALLVYPVFRSETVEHVMFGFPELVLVIMGLLVLMGGYTGYRLSDLIRFRALGQAA